MNGQITRSVSGSYYVQSERGIYVCRARGIFRKKNIKPLVGDFVLFDETSNREGVINQIEERKNELIRPAVSNVDALCYVMSAVCPEPNFLVLDKMTVLCALHGIDLYIVLNKTDLGCSDDVRKKLSYYEKIGYNVIYTCAESGEGVELVRAVTRNKTTVFSGNTGVGKSSILNALDSNILAATGEISQKLGRGKHTTREVTLFAREDGGYYLDTPGFGQIDLLIETSLLSQALSRYFREFPANGECRFDDCRHIGEEGCALEEMISDKRVADWRVDSYRLIYDELLKREQSEKYAK